MQLSQAIPPSIVVVLLLLGSLCFYIGEISATVDPLLATKTASLRADDSSSSGGGTGAAANESHVLVLYTGGTIGMKSTQNGGQPYLLSFSSLRSGQLLVQMQGMEFVKYYGGLLNNLNLVQKNSGIP